MPKRPFKRKQKKKTHGTNFWNAEYKNPENLSLSTKPGEDFLKFTRFLERHNSEILSQNNTVLDLGCGNGRQLIYLYEMYKMNTIGYDTSKTAIEQARSHLSGNNNTFLVRSISETLPIPNKSISLILDLMVSHFLSKKQRDALLKEQIRVLTPGGFLLMKTFLGDDDLHTKRLLKEQPGPEPQTYIHPIIGVPEYVYFEEDLRAFLEPYFEIVKIYRSHKHKLRGKARKRRTITVYAKLKLGIS